MTFAPQFYPFTLPVGEIGTLDAAVRDNTLRPGYVPV